MPQQQSKRRRKRYEPGSAYAGDVKPTGILGFISGAGMVKLIFIGMALALAIGGGATIFSGNLFRTPIHENSFILPDDNPGPTAAPPAEIVVTQYSVPPPFTIDPSRTYEATIRTELGDIIVELLPNNAPETVNNFVFLAEEGFYNGLAFHSVASGFSATAGDPACTAADFDFSRFCDGGPGYELNEDVEGEITTGSLGMANGSQFFIALDDSTRFESFAPFGTIASALDAAQLLVANTEIQSIEIGVQ